MQSYTQLKYIHQKYIQSPELKRLYKLKETIREILIICGLEFPCIFNHAVDISEYVLNKLSDIGIVNRGKVRHGILAVCIYYACKQMSIKITYNDISSALQLPIKYIRNAETTIIELINNNTINLDKGLFLYNKTAIDYIIENALNIPDEILKKTIDLIKTCEKNEILSGNSPLAISTGCLYYVLVHFNIDTNINLITNITNMYEITESTIRKVYKIILKNKFGNFNN